MHRVFIRATVCTLMITTLVLIAGCQSAQVAVPTADVNHPYNETANAQQDINAAFVLAKADQKYVLLDFGGNWCPDCLVLAKFYETEPLKSFVVKNYHIVAVDIGQFDKNLDISNRYGSPITQGVPAVVVLDASGKMIGSTGDGALESARSMTIQQVLEILKNWVPSKT